MPVTQADIALANRLADAAGAAIRPRFRAELGLETKDDRSPVTLADREAEEAMRRLIVAEAPRDGILGEEYGAREGTSGRQWVLDPIDGTRAFIAGRADWTVSVALVEQGRPIVAALYAPASEEFFLAVVDGGATRNGGAIRASDGEGLAGARVSGPKRLVDLAEAAVPDAVVVPRVHSLALRLARVADATLDLAFAGGASHDWDLAAADLLVHEAGGLLTTFEGGELSYNGAVPTHGTLVAAGRARHRALIRVLQPTAMRL